jgi:hypothetical protein
MSNGIKKLLSAALACGAFGGSLAGLRGNVYAMDAGGDQSTAAPEEVEAEKNITPIGGNWSESSKGPQGQTEALKGNRLDGNRDAAVCVYRAVQIKDGKPVSYEEPNIKEYTAHIKSYQRNFEYLFPTAESKAAGMRLRAVPLECYKLECRAVNADAVGSWFNKKYQTVEDTGALAGYKQNFPGVLASVSRLYQLPGVGDTKITSSTQLMLTVEEFMDLSEKLNTFLRGMPNRMERGVRMVITDLFYPNVENSFIMKIVNGSDFQLQPKSKEFLSKWIRKYVAKNKARLKGLDNLIAEREKQQNANGGKNTSAGKKGKK